MDVRTRALSGVALLVTALAVAAATAGAGGAQTHVEPSAGSRVLYLTFDDGPSPRWTPQVLELLRRYRAQATFFVVGSLVDAYPALVRRLVREGHALGNHTYGHIRLTRMSEREFAAELERADAAIRRVTGTSSLWLRPPYGAIDASTRVRAARRGYRLVMWDVDPQDWRQPSAESIAAHVLGNARPGAIVLLHDGGGDRSQTIAALERILSGLCGRGYSFRTLSL